MAPNNNVTSDGKKGGWLKGKRHSAGGMKAVVVNTGTPIEVEGGEIIITRKAAKEHCEELSKINQSGGGVAIPCDVSDSAKSTFADGGPISEFQIGKYYNHPIFGKGELMKIDNNGNVLELSFDVGHKRLFREFSRLTELSTGNDISQNIEIKQPEVPFFAKPILVPTTKKEPKVSSAKKASAKKTIKDIVVDNSELLKGMKTHTELRDWAIKQGFDNRSAFPKFKTALNEIGLDYDGIKTGINKLSTEKLENEITHTVTMYCDAKASAGRFGITDEDGNVLWHGRFFEDDDAEEQSRAELSAAKKAVWLAGKVKESIGAKAIEFNLIIDAQWLTYQTHGGQKGYALTVLARKYNIKLNVQWIPGKDNPADKWTIANGYKKWQDNDLKALAIPIKKTTEIIYEPEIENHTSKEILTTRLKIVQKMLSKNPSIVLKARAKIIEKMIQNSEQFRDGGDVEVNKFNYNKSKITFDDFHLSTFADYKKIKTKEIPQRPADYISRSGSKYWYQNDSVIRESNHWGRTIASCNWLLNSCAYKGQSQGICKLSDFKRIKENLLWNNTESIGKSFTVGKTVLRRNGGGCMDITTNTGTYLKESSDYYIFDNFKVAKQTLAYVVENKSTFRDGGLIHSLNQSMDNLVKNGIVVTDEISGIKAIIYNTGNQSRKIGLYNFTNVYKIISKINKDAASRIIVNINHGVFDQFKQSKIKDYENSKVLFVFNQNEVVYSSENTFNFGGQLQKGILEEREHTDTAQALWDHEITPEQAAKQIAIDHLKEDSHYYTKLNKTMIKQNEFGLGGPVGTNAEYDKAVSDLDKAEKLQNIMKTANSIIRSKKNVTARLVSEAGLTESNAIAIQQKDFANRIGFPTWKLTNNNATIKRLQERVKMLEGKLEGAEKGNVTYEFEKDGGGTVEVNYDIDRVQIIYNSSRVSHELFKELRSNGYVFSRTNSAFQRKITPQAIRNALHFTNAKMADSKESEIIVEQDQAPAAKEMGLTSIGIEVPKEQEQYFKSKFSNEKKLPHYGEGKHKTNLFTVKQETKYFDLDGNEIPKPSKQKRIMASIYGKEQAEFESNDTNNVEKVGSVSYNNNSQLQTAIEQFAKENNHSPIDLETEHFVNKNYPNELKAVEQSLPTQAEAQKEVVGSGVGGEVVKYSEPKRYNSEIEVGQKYYDNRYGDSYVIEKMTPVEGGDVDVTLKYDKGKTRTESGNFLLYHIDAKQHSLSKIDKFNENQINNKGEFMDNLHPLDMWVQFGGGRWYRKFQVPNDNNVRELTDAGIKERMSENNGIVEAIISVRSESESDMVSKLYMELYPNKSNSDYQKELKRQSDAGEIENEDNGISLYHLSKNINKPKEVELPKEKGNYKVGDIVLYAGRNVIELTKVGKTKFDGFTANRRSYPSGLSLSSVTPASQEQINSFIEEAYKPEFWNNKYQYKPLINKNPEEFSRIEFLKKQIANGEKLMAKISFTGDITPDINRLKAELDKLENKPQTLKEYHEGVNEANERMYVPNMPVKEGGYSIEEVEKFKEDYRATESDKIFKGVSHEYKNQYVLNKAIEELLDSKTDNNSFSSDEKNFIRKYSGYGGLDKYGTTGKGGLFEFYTPSEIIEKMWALAYKFGYDNGPILEPSIGTGEFLRYSPKDVRVVGYDISRFSARICKILYPNTEINIQPFEQIFIKNNYTVKDKTDHLEKYKLIIGNPPYGDFSIVESRYMSGMGEKDFTKARNYVEYFIRRGMDLLESGGLLIYIVGSQLKAGGKMFLDGEMTPVKEWLMENANFETAYRLPDSVFERTGVTADIIVLRKK